jgi:hypothetical protein
MSAKYRQVRARFGPEMRFRVEPAPPGPFWARQQAELERLKAQLLAARLGARQNPQSAAQLQRAAAEAAALAWVTRYPLLVFPALFEEMAEAALLRVARQAQISQRSRELLAA